jgi:glycosyltransferase involved in cell wall biosynthesis
MKPKILIVTEYSGLNVGYGIYGRHLINGLLQLGIEVAELAIGVNAEYIQQFPVPWKVYPSIPSNEEDKKQHDSMPSAAFGAWAFERVLLDFKPTHVLTYDDNWHYEYQLRSPFRQFFAHIAMPAVDAEPQHKQWLDIYEQSDIVLGYTQWGLDLIKKQNPRINTFKPAPPIAFDNYRPLQNRDELKKSLGLGNVNIIGMVARNQFRKLFPDLFRAFADYLNTSGRNDTYLYVHTTNHDRAGWQLDEEMIKYGIQSKVLYSYICRSCNNIDVCVYEGNISHCYSCGARNKTMAGPDFGYNHDQMAIVYNLMDLYVQWANMEGYGIPMVEACACGTPIIGVDYASLSEVIPLTGGTTIPPLGLNQEIASGRMMATPDNKMLSKLMNDFFVLPQTMRNIKRKNTRRCYEKNWSLEKLITPWVEAISQTGPKKSWDAPKNIFQPQQPPPNLNNQDFVRWLIVNVLGEPERCGTWFETRVLADLDSGISFGGFGDKFYHPLSATNFAPNTKPQKFDRELIYGHFLTLVDERNMWESRRVPS